MRKITLLLTALLTCIAVGAQNRDIRIPTEGGRDINTEEYTRSNTGFFVATDLSTGMSLNGKGSRNWGFGELDAVGGYRFSEYLRAGIGMGARYYFHVGECRATSHKWAMPLFLNLRGNFIPTGYRDVVPFWSIDFGTTFPDGVMFRPTLGIRVGQQRSAFTVALGYLGQHFKSLPDAPDFYSGITLKLGYEF